MRRYFSACRRPFRSLQEGMLYYSEKHKLYRFMVEVLVLANGLNENIPCYVLDFELFQRHRRFHLQVLKMWKGGQ